MRALPPLAINGKFLAAPPTGVHRVAEELCKALAALASERPDLLDIELWTPLDAIDPERRTALPVRRIRPFTGIPWEQLATPFRNRRRVLLNLCNIGPILRSNSVTMIHDAQVHLTPKSYSKSFRIRYKLAQSLLGRHHRAILTVSNYSRDRIAEAGICPADRIAVIHNGVDHIARVQPEPEIVAQLGLAGKRYVVAAASTQVHKNIALLSRAFGSPELADIALVLVGDNSSNDFARAGIGLPPQTLFTGRVSDGALRSLYESALCIAFPSLTEGFGLPPLEAMLMGCPAIVAPCGALPEVCGDAAPQADSTQPEEWRRLIRAFADDSGLRSRYAALGRERAARFTWRAAALQLVDVLAAVTQTAQPQDEKPGSALEVPYLP